MSEHTYQRSEVACGWDLDSGVATDIQAALPGAFGVACSAESVSVSFADELTPEQVATLDATVEAYRLAAESRLLARLKGRRMVEIDERTRELIENGFEFPPASGNIFSLSREFQLMLAGLNQEREAPEVVYPIDWNTADDSAKISLANADMVRSFYLLAVGTVRARRDSGTTLKDQVRAATTVAEVQAIIDNR